MFRNRFRFAWAGLVLASCLFAQKPTDSKAVYVVTHIDSTPDFAEQAKKVIEKYVADSRKEPGIVRIEGMVQTDRTNHFTVVEVWQSRAAFEAHTASARTREFRQTIQPMLGSPFDERLHSALP